MLEARTLAKTGFFVPKKFGQKLTEWYSLTSYIVHFPFKIPTLQRLPKFNCFSTQLLSVLVN